MALPLPSSGYMGQRLTRLFPDFGQDLGNFDIDFEPMDGDSSGGAVSFSPEKMRDGSSIDGASIRASSKRSSRMSADSFDIPNSYNLDGGDSDAKSAKSRRSRLSIMGLGDDPFNMDQRSHNALESQLSDVTLSLREEPESHPSMQPHQSQLPMSQRITPYQQTIAQKAAAYFAKNDGDDAKLRFFEMANPNFKTTHTAAKMFYALLVLVNESIVTLAQEASYGDIDVTPTPNTLNYNL